MENHMGKINFWRFRKSENRED